MLLDASFDKLDERVEYKDTEVYQMPEGLCVVRMRNN